MEGLCWTNQILFAEKCSPDSLSTCSGRHAVCKNCTKNSRPFCSERRKYQIRVLCM